LFSRNVSQNLPMKPEQFVAKWSKIQQKESAVSHSYFIDICALAGHAPPVAYDPDSKNFSFEKRAAKPGKTIQIKFDQKVPTTAIKQILKAQAKMNEAKKAIK